MDYAGGVGSFSRDDIAIVLHFERTAGSPTYHKAVWVTDIVDGGWALYNTATAWREAYETQLVKTRP